MSAPELGIVATFLVGIVKIAVHEEPDSLLQGYLMASDSPIYLSLLSAIEAVDVHKRSIAATVTVAQDCFTRICAFDELNVAKSYECLCTYRIQITGQDMAPVPFVSNEGCDDWYSLCTGPTDDENLLNFLSAHTLKFRMCWGSDCDILPRSR